MRRIAHTLVGVLTGVALTAAAAAAGGQAPEFHVLSIGVEPTMTARGQRDLYAGDADFIANALTAARPYYRTVLTRKLRGEQASREGVTQALADLEEQMRPQDQGVIFFSTHGSWDPDDGYTIYLAGSHRNNGADQVLRGAELNRAIGKIRGRVTVLLDTCSAAGALPAKGGRAAYLTACGREESSFGQTDNPNRPHGFFVIAAVEGLQGRADTDRDGAVTVSELEAYVPNRARALCAAQNAVTRVPRPQAGVRLAKADAVAAAARPFEMEGARNPFGLKDVGRPFGSDVQQFADRSTPAGGPRDENARSWPRRSTGARADSVEGSWAGRWRSGNGEWRPGFARLKVDGERVFILQHDRGAKYMIEARRTGDRLAGRYINLNDPADTSPWAGKIVGNQRIDGAWSGGRWDFRRRLD